MSIIQAIVKSFRQHLHIVRSYPLAMAIVLATVVEVFYFGHVQHRMFHAIGYIFGVWFCAFLTDVVVNIRPKPAIDFPIKKPVAREALVILGCTLLGAVFLAIRFSSLWPATHGFVRLGLILLLVFFTSPVALALIYFFLYRYKPKELGFNLRYWYLPLLIHPIWGAITFAVAPDKSHWHSFIQDRGFFGGLVFAGIISAALPEEFTRLLLQTRLGSFFRNKGLGFVAASFIWACLHIPVNHSQNPEASLASVVVGSWVIMPVGFLWGYITHRTKSLVPAILVHGLNLWGLQNF
jgi:membrane protease YdiL (CAAX protease family)